MEIKKLVHAWFDTWQKGNFHDLPIAKDFKHTSPFGTIEGKQSYIDLIEKNKDKFLGYTFEILDEIYEANRASVRYKAVQGNALKLDVSEWYTASDGLIDEIVAYYHIGEIRNDRQIEGYQE